MQIVPANVLKNDRRSQRMRTWKSSLTPTLSLTPLFCMIFRGLFVAFFLRQNSMALWGARQVCVKGKYMYRNHKRSKFSSNTQFVIPTSSVTCAFVLFERCTWIGHGRAQLSERCVVPISDTLFTWSGQLKDTSNPAYEFAYLKDKHSISEPQNMAMEPINYMYA